MIPTRWRTLFEDQIEDAERRVGDARGQMDAGDGGRAMQSAYQAVVTAAGIRVWMTHHPWDTTLPASEMQRLAVEQFPDQYAALAAMDLPNLLRGFWSPESASSYVEEAGTFVATTRTELEAWVSAS